MESNCILKITAKGKQGSGKTLMLGNLKRLLAKEGIKSFLNPKNQNELVTEKITLSKTINLYGKH